ncbi:MAG: sigma-54 dependent transcriptional regulator [Desulfobacteraceae bacterium]|jgi:DNA-binding NtrC family response regulator|nr:sigma-54 dependent transcriptional regulator [Desulfobacteraceae bacterium]
MNKTTVLVVDDEEITLHMLKVMIGKLGYQVLTAESGEQALDVMDINDVDLVISDQHMPGMDGHALLQRIKKKHEYLPVIMLTAYGSIEKAVEAIKNGAIDYLTKPLHSDALRLVVERTLKYSRQDVEIREQKQFLSSFYGFDNIITRSSAMKDSIDLAARVAEIPNMAVAIYGESGTGKELFARAIHDAAGCAARRFVGVNCAAIPASLLESELFGHAKGAFTGADKDRAGKFDVARQGTLLLDEIGDMPIDLQPKLLRVLEEGSYERVGSNILIDVNTRVIATTNHDLEEHVDSGKFRRDLFHRINRFPIFLPPLRERKEDIPLLADHFLEKFRQELGKPLSGISKTAMDVLIEHKWPGNVRELKNLIERAAIITKGELIEPDHLHSDTRVKRRSDTDMIHLDIQIPADRFSLAAVAEKAQEIILNRCNGNKSKAADMLKISRTQFYR